MENKNLKLVELSNHDILEINGGEGFAEDVGIFVGYHVKWNYNVLKWAYETITG